MPTDANRSRGRVSLVGGGPGDPRLLTVRAAELLRHADVVAYDALVPTPLIEMAGPQAELVSVGRRAHGPSSCEYRLHPAVLERARAGLHVVRLKAGDPFVFGRGGEEAEELLEEGIPFEIVPGVSAAFGAAACAGIPLTHRDHSSDVVLATGHDIEGGKPSKSSWAHLGASRGTVVLYMATRKLDANLARLVEGGRAATTPAAYVAAASTGAQTVIVATVGTLADAARHVDRAAPAVVIIGEVVALRERLAWFERGPLFGKNVVLARDEPGTSPLRAHFEALGASVVDAPRIEVTKASDGTALALVASPDARFGALLFTSTWSVDAFVAKLAELDVDVRDLSPARLFASSEDVRAHLRIAGFRAEILDHAALGPLRLAADRGPIAVLAAEGSARCHALTVAVASGIELVDIATHAVHARPPRVAAPSPHLVVAPNAAAVRALFVSLEGASMASLRDVPLLALRADAATAALGFGVTHVHRLCDAARVDQLLADATALLVRHV